MYRHLDASQIQSTLRTLRQRIEERFPASGLGRVCDELLDVSVETARNAEYLRRPLWPVRAFAILLTVGLIGVFGIAVVVAISGPVGEPAIDGSVWDVLQGIEALVNDVVFLGVAIWFALTLETRLKQRRALRAIHELRSIAHIIDMHQLTKDPERLLVQGVDTASSPVRNMTREELGRYLDYCSELLAMTSKLAALYVQNFADPVVLETVSEVETLATGLSSKVWQKITLLEPVMARTRLEPARG